MREYRPGSREDFDRLYRDSYTKIRATLLGMLGDPTAAEDCAQDTFVRAFAAWGRWKPDAPAEAWLHRIAFNVATTARRRERIRSVGEHIRRVGIPAPAPDPADTSRADLVAALRRLPPKQAAVIMLRHFHGYTNREIAVAVGVSERTVATRLAAAREALQFHLRWAGDGDERVRHLEEAAAGPETEPRPEVEFG